MHPISGQHMSSAQSSPRMRAADVNDASRRLRCVRMSTPQSVRQLPAQRRAAKEAQSSRCAVRTKSCEAISPFPSLRRTCSKRRTTSGKTVRHAELGLTRSNKSYQLDDIPACQSIIEQLLTLAYRPLPSSDTELLHRCSQAMYAFLLQWWTRQNQTSDCAGRVHMLNQEWHRSTGL